MKAKIQVTAAWLLIECATFKEVAVLGVDVFLIC
jgi:hypothetical protein